MTKRGICIFLGIIFCLLLFLFFIAIRQSKSYPRDSTVLMNKYYLFKYTHPDIAKESLQIILKQNPKHAAALKEYNEWLFLHHHVSKSTISVLTAMQSFLPDLEFQEMSRKARHDVLSARHDVLSARHDRHDVDPYYTAMERAYQYNRINNNRMAYAYFQKAAKSPNQALALQAENAMTHLVGQQTRSFSDPYYGEIFFMPFSQSHFNLVINQLIARLGIEQPNRLQTKEYMFTRRTSDNRSENLGQLSEIYEDNVQIFGMGVQISPLPRVPLIGYIEGGAAYDLVYRSRELWRGDLRGGFMYYQEVGKMAAYYPSVTIKPDYYATYYGDITYFSRYANNVIGTLRTHQGVRAVQYKSTMLNLYLKGRLIQDSQRQFFNNIFEAGPGLGLIPSNRYNIELRFEYLRGVYLPAGGSFNPYNKYYVNKVAQLLCYVKF